jgi:hypothetical protein
MSDDLDLKRMAEIPDPFAGPSRVTAPERIHPASASPTRSQVRKRRAIAAAAVVAYEVGWVLVVERRPDLGQLPAWSIALGLVIPLAAAALALVAVTGAGKRGLGAPASWLAGLTLMPPPLFALATLVVGPLDAGEGHFWNLAARCMGITLLLTTGPLVLGAVVFRHAFAAAAVWRTAALGVACGAMAAATMSLACWHVGALHAIVGHGTMMLVGGIVGALLGRRVTRS